MTILRAKVLYQYPDGTVTTDPEKSLSKWKNLIWDINRYMELTKPPKPIYEQLVDGLWNVDGSNESGNLIHVPVRVANYPADFLLNIQKLYRTCYCFD